MNHQQKNQKMCQDYSPKGWSNAAGYGHLVQASVQSNGSVVSNAHPWNRIQPLGEPSNTLVDKSAAWSPPISSSLEQQLNESCNICQSSGKPQQQKFQGFEAKEYAPLV